MLAKRIRGIGMSATVKVTGLAIKLRAEGVDVLDFSVGEPDLPTPEGVKEAGKRAIDTNQTRYTSNAGLIELREAIAEKFLRDNGLTYAPGEILVSSGAKASLYFAAMALFQEGDEVLLPSPYWVSYPEQVRLAGARPVIVPTREKNGFKLRPEELQAAVTPRTKAVILNYPSNPTGACYDRDELEGLAESCLKHGLLVLADEIYEKLIYNGRTFTSIASLGPEIKARTVVINGMSKAFAMTGWRVGYAAGPREIIGAMAKIQSHSTSNAASISQWASLEALRAAEADVARMVGEFESRRDEMMRGLGRLPGIRCAPPDGAFYVFPDISALLGGRVEDRKIATSEDLAAYLLETARVAVVPGEGFGSPHHIRISYAASMEQIREGLERIGRALDSLAL